MELFLSALMMHSYSATTHFLLCHPPPSSYWSSPPCRLRALCVFKEVVNVCFGTEGVSAGHDSYILFPRDKKKKRANFPPPNDAKEPNIKALAAAG